MLILINWSELSVFIVSIPRHRGSIISHNGTSNFRKHKDLFACFGSVVNQIIDLKVWCSTWFGFGCFWFVFFFFAEVQFGFGIRCLNFKWSTSMVIAKMAWDSFRRRATVNWMFLCMKLFITGNMPISLIIVDVLACVIAWLLPFFIL